jgi:hypothetical protein
MRKSPGKYKGFRGQGIDVGSFYVLIGINAYAILPQGIQGD